MGTETKSSLRRYDLDWLRVLAILIVFIFHSGRFFDLMGWHVKSATVYPVVQAWTNFLIGWLMPFMFVLSGASLSYAVGKGSAAGFIRDKVLRLLVPFLVGMFTHVALQVYLERLSHHQFSGSFFEFYPHYFEGWYGFGGNFAWMGLHLWYLQILFIFCLVLFPLFFFLKGPARGLLEKIGNVLAIPGVLMVLIVPVLWLSAVMSPHSFLGNRGFGGWPFPVYAFFLFYGFVIFSNDRLQEHIRRSRLVYLGVGALTSLIILWQFGYQRPGSGPQLLYFGFLQIAGSWCWILAFIGYGINYLTGTRPFLKYANEAVLPFYVMHQTVLLLLGYFILQWPIPDVLKWLLIAIGSFFLCLGLYEYAVKRFNILRILFGMKPAKAAGSRSGVLTIRN